MTDSPEPWDEGTPKRLYVITGGRQLPEQAALDLVTLIVSRSSPQPGMKREHAAILGMCPYPLSVAEISAYLGLPFSVVTVLLAELIQATHIEARRPVPAAALPDISLLEEVIRGLHKL
jgi:hypothetical protein